MTMTCQNQQLYQFKAQNALNKHFLAIQRILKSIQRNSFIFVHI